MLSFILEILGFVSMILSGAVITQYERRDGHVSVSDITSEEDRPMSCILQFLETVISSASLRLLPGFVSIWPLSAQVLYH
jgi:hypothetical protein